ncbi:hypothetical protein ACFP9V_24660 [Deinococcus radiopugnans]|uniref:ZIP family zinc transporter n=1 Tax=Deinococcus radiopugnans ATCC 19172 TaxID=585398 RepID=A0ABR6P0B5_9DEIO|nr:hypothetical protein [Deinococcus radiopugnans]MBB6018910.1 ZIP family zinc transporter [Deinococcus radiopugnans ATCC 19172]
MGIDILIDGLLIGVGLAAGERVGTLLQGLSGLTLEIVLSFGAAALLYLVTEELPGEAHQIRETPWITGAFFLGFIALYLIELLA